MWGNVVNAHVLAQPAQSLVLKDLIDASILKEVSELVDVELKIPTTHLPVNYAALERSYNEAQLAPHRFAYPLVQEIMAHPSKLSALQVLPKHLLGEYKFDLSKVIEQIANTDGNIDFEELNCIGLQPKATLDQLVGVLKVKNRRAILAIYARQAAGSMYVSTWILGQAGKTWVSLRYKYMTSARCQKMVLIMRYFYL